MTEEKKTCYMCDNEVISMEHVPPACLFPEIKDTKGINFRKNLIKVPHVIFIIQKNLMMMNFYCFH